MDEIQNFLNNKWHKPYGVGYLMSDDALEFVMLCKKHQIRISGFDGFHRRTDVSPSAVQIDQKFSANYSDIPTEKGYELASEYFTKHKGDGMLYEFTYSH